MRASVARRGEDSIHWWSEEREQLVALGHATADKELNVCVVRLRRCSDGEIVGHVAENAVVVGQSKDEVRGEPEDRFGWRRARGRAAAVTRPDFFFLLHLHSPHYHAATIRFCKIHAHITQ